MYMKPMRFSLRWLVLVVAIAAVAAWGWRLHRLASRYLALAEMHAIDENRARFWIFVSRPVVESDLAMAKELEIMAKEFGEFTRNVKNPYDWEGLPKDVSPASLSHLANSSRSRADRDAEDLEKWERIAAHHFALKTKYSRAARRPWLPVAPDPPMPE